MTKTAEWQLVSVNVPGNLHSVTEWVNRCNVADLVIHMESSGGNSIVVLRMQAAHAPKFREKMGFLPEALPNKPIFSDMETWR